MKVTQEKLPASQIGLEIEIPPELSQKTYEQVIANFARSVNIPGFRKGKVPRQILLQQIGLSRIKAATLEELIQIGLEKALKQEELEIIGTPQLRSSFDDLVNDFDPSKALIFLAAVDVEPEVKLYQHSGLQIRAEEIKYNPSQVENVLDEKRQEMATLIPVEGRPAQLGDIAVIDFKGYLAQPEGEDSQKELKEISGAEGTDYQVDLQTGRFIEGFVDGIVGMNLEETKEVKAKFPEDYGQKDVAGQDVIFRITLKELKEKELPEVDDDFAQEASDFETIAELRASLESRFQKEAQDKTKANKEQALVEELLNHLEVELPETLIEEEVNHILTRTAMELSQQGIDFKKIFTQENLPGIRQRTRLDAIDSLKRTLALQQVAKLESIEVEHREIEVRIREVLASYDSDDLNMDKLRQVVTDNLQQEKVLKWLEEHAIIELFSEGEDAVGEQAPTEESQLIEPQVQAPTEESQLIEPQVQAPTEESQLIEPQVQAPTEESQLIEPQV